MAGLQDVYSKAGLAALLRLQLTGQAAQATPRTRPQTQIAASREGDRPIKGSALAAAMELTAYCMAAAAAQSIL